MAQRNPFNIPAVIDAVDKAIKESLAIAGKDAVAQFKRSFTDQGFTDNTLNAWKTRQGSKASYGKISFRKGSVGHDLLGNRATMIKTGNLRRSIRIAFMTGTMVKVQSKTPYSAIHNEGGTGRAWGKYTFQMPKRKFMGNSKSLEKRTLAKITAKINTAIRNAR